MYVIPAIALGLVILLSIVWSPIFALIIAVPLFVGFLLYVGISRSGGSEERQASGEPATGEGAERGGIWGEKPPQ